MLTTQYVRNGITVQYRISSSVKTCSCGATITMSMSPGASAQPSWYPITSKLTASSCQASAAHTGVDLTVIHISIRCWFPSTSVRSGSHDSRRECGGGGLGNDVFPTDHRSLPLLIMAGALRPTRVRHTLRSFGLTLCCIYIILGP